MLMKRIVIEIALKERPATDAEFEAIAEEVEEVVDSVHFPTLLANRIADGHESLTGKLSITVSGI